MKSKDDNDRRIFIGVPVLLEPDFIKDFSILKNDLRKNKISWVKNHLMHITIRFIGDISQDKVMKLKDDFVRFTIDDKFDLNTGGIGVFESNRIPKVIYVNVIYHAPWIKLNSEVNKMLEKYNIASSDKQFTPHLTLGRVRLIKDSRSFQLIKNKFQPGFKLKQKDLRLCLYQSILTNDGPVYEILKSVPLINL
ncbi:RNA 2',3'-cyclic phosphodiesterase [Carboxylicivirga caseinilyticus]|uniref:RNA 2',3'-cyclic phosphodiesterase n=1 Tax=Carboxylicivirga caseinilyticus TaxID=3417572 RepID=UPI003D346D62|nr:RNA 2',3'-cyclic phosphodiesterase [Marinilabiliaceae bacterium A049]